MKMIGSSNKESVENKLNLGRTMNPSEKDQSLVDSLFEGTPGSSHKLIEKQFEKQFEKKYNCRNEESDTGYETDIQKEYMKNLNIDGTISTKYD